MGSQIFAPGVTVTIISVILAGCGDLDRSGYAEPAQPGPATLAPTPPSPAIPHERSLGVADLGIWPDLDDQVQIDLPRVDPSRVTGRIDRNHHLLVVSVDGFPSKPYPIDVASGSALRLGDRELLLRPGDRDELTGLLAPGRINDGAFTHDKDGDGIPDSLDVFIGAKKELLNAESYTTAAEDYIGMRYPMGDVARDIGVCTDVIIRAVRNAGHDLQAELHDDIRRARSAYPMVKGSGDASIDQRRVGTLLPYFKRHWESHSVKPGDPDDPWRPGDVILMDTFPDRPGPDHIGIVSDHLDDSGLPLIINNWTVGTVVAEMDLLTFVPVLYRFRLPP
jgi:uncharacterized protein